MKCRCALSSHSLHTTLCQQTACTQTLNPMSCWAVPNACRAGQCLLPAGPGRMPCVHALDRGHGVLWTGCSMRMLWGYSSSQWGRTGWHARAGRCLLPVMLGRAVPASCVVLGSACCLPCWAVPACCVVLGSVCCLPCWAVPAARHAGQCLLSVMACLLSSVLLTHV